MKHNIVDITTNTLTNTEGLKIFVLLDKTMSDAEVTDISFDGVKAMSSSFLNSSFGSLIEKYGFEKFKQFVKPRNLTLSVANQLRSYLESCNLKV